jgi:hypothetical protein
MGLGRIPIGFDERMTGQDSLHRRALRADPAAVNQPDLPEPRLVCRFDIVGDHVLDVLWAERMQVERALNRHSVNNGRPQSQGFW